VITIGATIAPNSNPNLNQILFGYTNILGNIKAENKKLIDAINAQIRGLLEFIRGYRDTIKNIIEKTTPKDFSVGCLLEI